jgi:hypothetical protein
MSQGLGPCHTWKHLNVMLAQANTEGVESQSGGFISSIVQLPVDCFLVLQEDTTFTIYIFPRSGSRNSSVKPGTVTPVSPPVALPFSSEQQRSKDPCWFAPPTSRS